MKYCTKCGKKIEDNTKFCPACGNPTSKNINQNPNQIQENILTDLNNVKILSIIGGLMGIIFGFMFINKWYGFNGTFSILLSITGLCIGLMVEHEDKGLFLILIGIILFFSEEFPCGFIPCVLFVIAGILEVQYKKYKPM